MTQPNKTWEEEFDEKLMNSNSMPCCRVCQCENGKKIWCACHREQLKYFIRKTLQAERERVIGIVEGMRKECKENPNVCADMGCIVGEYNQALSNIKERIEK